jgi:predicted nucleic acid-binding protein
MWQVVRRLAEHGAVPVVPADVVAEWWRGRSDIREHILGFVDVEPLTDALARLAGEALAKVRGATTVDAVVMASAAQRGDAVYTTDIDDLERLRAFFPSVRVFAAG